MATLPTTSDLPPNRCVRCRRQRRKAGLYCRLCHAEGLATLRRVAATPWQQWEVYSSVDVPAYERRVLTELRRLCDAEKRPPTKETP